MNNIDEKSQYIVFGMKLKHKYLQFVHKNIGFQ